MLSGNQQQARKSPCLDGSEVETLADTLLITDGSGPIGLAGVMGGLSTSVTNETKDIFLEGAFFAPTAIAGRARSYGMNTDAGTDLSVVSTGRDRRVRLNVPPNY